MQPPMMQSQRWSGEMICKRWDQGGNMVIRECLQCFSGKTGSVDWLREKLELGNDQQRKRKLFRSGCDLTQNRAFLFGRGRSTSRLLVLKASRKCFVQIAGWRLFLCSPTGMLVIGSGVGE